jgi:hypothetical protein
LGDRKKAFFWIKNGRPDPTTIHWGFVAENDKQVNSFYEAAMSGGAKDCYHPIVGCNARWPGVSAHAPSRMQDATDSEAHKLVTEPVTDLDEPAV